MSARQLKQGNGSAGGNEWGKNHCMRMQDPGSDPQGESDMDPSERQPTDSEEVTGFATSSTETGRVAETDRQRFSRRAHRTRLYLYAFAAVALLVFLVALAATNTSHVKVSWVFGTSSVSLVWLVLFSAVIGWLLGTVIGIMFHWRTRRPREPKSASPDDQVRP
jgi:uncharacterized integral membrane protein